MVARGYGLIAPEPDGRLHRRPAWSAMKTLIAELGGALFTETLPSRGGVWLYRFDRDGRTIVVAWSLQTGASAELPAPAVTATSRDGAALPTPDGTSIATGPSPVYYVLEM